MVLIRCSYSRRVGDFLRAFFHDDGIPGLQSTKGTRWPGGRVARPSASQPISRVPLDKSEGSVKGLVVLGGAWTPLFLPEGLRTKTLEHHA